jgi:hypothetical protein
MLLECLSSDDWTAEQRRDFFELFKQDPLLVDSRRSASNTTFSQAALGSSLDTCRTDAQVDDCLDDQTVVQESSYRFTLFIRRLFQKPN